MPRRVYNLFCISIIEKFVLNFIRHAFNFGLLLSMPKFTYPIVFIFNEATDYYNGYVPDLGICAYGEKLEEVYANAENMVREYFIILLKEGFEVPTATSLEDITKKWKNYKVSLLTANLPDPK